MNKPQSTIGAVEADGVERQHRDEAKRIQAEKSWSRLVYPGNQTEGVLTNPIDRVWVENSLSDVINCRSLVPRYLLKSHRLGQPRETVGYVRMVGAVKRGTPRWEGLLSLRCVTLSPP
jgi:hypothetical protein